MSGSGDYSGFNFADFELSVLRDLNKLKLVISPFRSRTHDDRDMKLGMTTEKIGMVVCKHDILKVGTPFGNKISVDEIVVGGVDEVGFSI